MRQHLLRIPSVKRYTLPLQVPKFREMQKNRPALEDMQYYLKAIK